MWIVGFGGVWIGEVGLEIVEELSYLGIRLMDDVFGCRYGGKRIFWSMLDIEICFLGVYEMVKMYKNMDKWVVGV